VYGYYCNTTLKHYRDDLNQMRYASILSQHYLTFCKLQLYFPDFLYVILLTHTYINLNYLFTLFSFMFVKQAILLSIAIHL